MSEFVLAWNGGEYADASARFADVIVGSREDPVAPSAGSACEAQDQYLAALVGRFLDYWNAGRRDDAARILEDIRTYPVEARLVEHRDLIARSLDSGPNGPMDSASTLGCF